MDPYPPFTEQEKRFVLAEAIKTSEVPVEKLLPVFYDGSIQPVWRQMLLPQGRNTQACMDTFDALRRVPPPQPPTAFQTYQVPPPSRPTTTKRKPPPEGLETAGGHDPKRRLSDMAQHTNILPKPSNVSPKFSSPNTTPGGKKRGRPSKAAVAQRDAEAIARGEVIAPPRTSSLRSETPGGGERISTPVYANIAPMVSPRPMASPGAPPPPTYGSPSFTGSEVSSPKKKRPPPKKSTKPGEASFSVASPRMGGERSTYPSIISSLTDTIPNQGSDYSPYRPSYPPQQPTQSLPPSSMQPSHQPPTILPPPANLLPPPPRTDSRSESRMEPRSEPRTEPRPEP